MENGASPFLVLFYAAFVAWPPPFDSIDPAGKNPKDPVSPVVFFEQSAAAKEKDAAATGSKVQINITYDQRLLLMVFILGALGGYVHVVTSFADYAGNRRLVKSWAWWYVLRPFAGAPTAAAFYFAVRAGFMTAGSTGGDVNRFGIAAVSMLVGMFSLKATDKLEEVFDVLFKTQEKRKDALQSGPPVLEGMTPGRVKAGAPKLNLTLSGANFSPKSVVLVDGESRTPHAVTATTLEIVLTAKELSQPRTIKLAVRNPAPANAVSAEREFTVEP